MVVHRPVSRGSSITGSENANVQAELWLALDTDTFYSLLTIVPTCWWLSILHRWWLFNDWWWLMANNRQLYRKNDGCGKTDNVDNKSGSRFIGVEHQWSIGYVLPWMDDENSCYTEVADEYPWKTSSSAEFSPSRADASWPASPTERWPEKRLPQRVHPRQVQFGDPEEQVLCAASAGAFRRWFFRGQSILPDLFNKIWISTKSGI